MKVNIGVWARILRYDPSLVCFNNKEEKNWTQGNAKKTIQSEKKTSRMQLEIWESERKAGGLFQI